MTVDGRTMEIHHEEEWSALYVDGNLVEVGPTYWVEEKAFTLLGVTEVTDNAFMRGQNQREGVAKTLAEVAAYRLERESRLMTAAQMRNQAEELLREAGRLEGSS